MIYVISRTSLYMSKNSLSSTFTLHPKQNEFTPVFYLKLLLFYAWLKKYNMWGDSLEFFIYFLEFD